MVQLFIEEICKELSKRYGHFPFYRFERFLGVDWMFFFKKTCYGGFFNEKSKIASVLRLEVFVKKKLFEKSALKKENFPFSLSIES